LSDLPEVSRFVARNVGANDSLDLALITDVRSRLRCTSLEMLLQSTGEIEAVEVHGHAGCQT
jgi:hypothetical protein